MGDIDKKKSAHFIQVTGSDVNGAETTPVKSFNTQELAVADILDDSGDNEEITVGTTAVEAKAGVVALVGRKSLTITNSGTTNLYWGYDPATAIASPKKGDRLFKHQTVFIDVSDDLPIYLVSDAAGGKATVLEGS